MDNADKQIEAAPLPTDNTVRARTNLVVQAWRFASVNLRMMKMVRKGHH
jgi:hypothetical protein